MKPTQLFKYLTTTLFSFWCAITVAQTNGYQYAKPISNITDGWNKIQFGNDINSRLQSNFADLRIYKISEKDTVETPFILDFQTQNGSVKTYVSNSISNLTVWQNEQISFVIEPAQKARINEVTLQFSETNFDALVQVLGSQDLKTWEPITEQQRIVGIQNANTNFSFTTVSFPDAQYAYYKFVIAAKSPLTIQSASIPNRTEELVAKAPKETYSSQAISAAQEKTQKRTNYFVNFPTAVFADALQLTFDNVHEFTRNIQIYNIVDSVQSEKGWIFTEELLSSCPIASFADLTITIPPALIGKLRISIENGDNPSLNLIKVTAQAPVYNLFTKLQTGNSYFLYFGQEKVNIPDYDIVHFKNQIPDSIPTASLGELKQLATNSNNNTSSEKTSFLSNPITLWTTLILLIVIIGWFTIKMLLQKEDTEQADKD